MMIKIVNAYFHIFTQIILEHIDKNNVLHFVMSSLRKELIIASLQKNELKKNILKYVILYNIILNVVLQCHFFKVFVYLVEGRQSGII